MSDPIQPSLQSQVSRAVLWNTVFVPLRMLAEIAATALKLTVLPIAAYGLLALISGASSAFGTWIDLGTTRALPKFIPETMKSHGPAGVLRMLLTVFWAQAIVLTAIAGGLIWQQSTYLGALADKIQADTRIDVVSQTLLQELLGSQGWLFITIIILMLITGVAYDMLMAFLNSFFKQRAWNGISLLAGLLPQLLAVCAIILAQLSTNPLRWSVIGILVTVALAPAIAVAVAAWQVVVVWRGNNGPPAPSDAVAFRWIPRRVSALHRGFVSDDDDGFCCKQIVCRLFDEQYYGCSIVVGWSVAGGDGALVFVHAVGWHYRTVVYAGTQRRRRHDTRSVWFDCAYSDVVAGAGWRCTRIACTCSATTVDTAIHRRGDDRVCTGALSVYRKLVDDGPQCPHRLRRTAARDDWAHAHVGRHPAGIFAVASVWGGWPGNCLWIRTVSCRVVGHVLGVAAHRIAVAMAIHGTCLRREWGHGSNVVRLSSRNAGYQ